MSGRRRATVMAKEGWSRGGGGVGDVEGDGGGRRESGMEGE